MQIGQVPIQYVPDAPINDVQSRTEEVVTGDTLIPSLAPFAPEPVPVVIEDDQPWGMFAAITGLLVFAWFMAKPGR